VEGPCGVPLRGAITQPGFHPFANLIRFLPKVSGGRAEYRRAAAVLPLRARNAAA
jgi:hypothetical protein